MGAENCIVATGRSVAFHVRYAAGGKNPQRRVTLFAEKMPTESDWKKFRAIVPVLRERYLADRNARIAALLAAPKKTETERFWNAMVEMEKEAKVLHQCLDGHTRSQLWLFIRLMICAGMLKKEDLVDFSEQLQHEASHVFEGK